MPATTLDYLRHGLPVGGTRFRGHGVDDPLSDTGWQQMQTTCAALSGWQQVISSPMRRCRAFAEAIAEERGLPLTVVDDLREVGFGAWEGIDRAELKTSRTSEYEAFYRDPVNNRPAGAEPLSDFGARIAAVFDELVSDYAGQHLLVVAHAGVIRATLGHVTQSPATTWYRAAVDNAAISRFAHDHVGSALIAHNWRPTL
ncbi:MAG: histidine phosphatase family protein [Gammaproteobacteria bacterium]|nr:histidine phosphatase family protein [Gammaproteobacteria bacterium]